MATALRFEIASAERRLEEERAAHAAARRSFVAREAELEATISESAAALTAMQRALDDRARKCAAAEERAEALEQQNARTSQKLASAESACRAKCGSRLHLSVMHLDAFRDPYCKAASGDVFSSHPCLHPMLLCGCSEWVYVISGTLQQSALGHRWRSCCL
jgi:hypothetical protein